VKEPSNCTDLQKAGNDQYSWEACKLRTGISVSCTSWPNSANNGCTSDGDDWTPLDKTTFGKDECESLCRQHASSDGCCFVGEEFGCYWKGRATASQDPDPNDKNFAVTCTASGNCNPNFVDKNGANCAKYQEKKWCMPTGGYGTHWNTYGHMGGTFEDYAVNGETALVCPECGC